MNPQIRSQLQALGPELSPSMIQATQRIFAERFGGIDSSTLIRRDHAYGPDERNRLDIFTAEGRRDAPVLVFVHGGGFVMGDKRSPTGLPFYENIGDFAVRSGYVGVTLTYRLAPTHRWPSGIEDLAKAVAWIRSNIREHGGDPQRIFLMGQSAGAVHVAGYVTSPQFHVVEGGGIAGALMISGCYDMARADVNQFNSAYLGEDPSTWGRASTLEGLVASKLPLFFSVSEFDGADFQRQASLLVSAYSAAHGRYPPVHWLAGHNHLSPVLAIGSSDETLGPRIREFIATAI